jgi:two-component system sensor histidine kinase QseC
MTAAPSLRRRLLLALVPGVLLVLAGAGFAVHAVVASRLGDDLDAALLGKARALEALTEQEGGVTELDYRPELMPEFQRVERPEHFQFWLDDGRVLLRSARLDGDLARQDGLVPGPRHADVALPGGRRGRGVQIAYVPGRARESADDEDGAAPTAPQRTVVLVVAAGREEQDAALGALARTLLLVCAGAGLVAALLVWRVVARGLAPLESVARQVGGLGAGRPGARVDLERAPRELAQVVTQLNALLGRLEEAVARERRFAGNVAHELRTPIAELMALAEVGRRWPDPESHERFLGDCEAIGLRMEGVVGDLLLLARCQAGLERAACEPVEVAPLLHTAWAALEPRARAAGLSVRWELPADFHVESDLVKLGVLVRNLLDNAVSHAHERAAVSVSVRTTATGVVLEVANGAAPLAPEQLARLAEPFWRADESRASGEHAGLGLALVDALAGVLGLTARFLQDADGTFRARVEGLRACPPSPSPAAGHAILSGSSGGPASWTESEEPA